MSYTVVMGSLMLTFITEALCLVTSVWRGIYCKPKQNMTIERYHFDTCVQGKQETLDQYMTELRLITKNCIFGELESKLVRN